MIPVITQPYRIISIGLQSIDIHHKKSKKSLNDTSIYEQETLQLIEIGSMFHLHVNDMQNES